MLRNTSSLQGPPGPGRGLVLLGRIVRRGALAALTLTVCVLFGAGAALAYWPASGTGNTTATVATLAPPTNVSGSATLSNVSVSWAASAGAVAPSGYYVTRITGGTPMPACGSGPAALIAASSCTDTSVAAGSHTYVVTAVHRSWTAVSAASAAVTVIINLSNKAAFTSQPPGSVTAGATMTGVRVQLQTKFLGLPIPTAGVPVTISIGTNPAGATLNGTLTVNTDGTGTATFSNLSITKAGAGYTLVASSPGYEGTVSTSITVTAAAATQLVVTSPPSVTGVASATANVGPITVERRDMYGNPTSAGQPSLALQTNPLGTGYFAATMGGSGPASLSIPAGSASASFYYGNTKMVSTSLQFSAPGLTAPQAVSVGVSAAAPSKLVFDAMPAEIPKNVAFSVTVRVEDAFSNQTQSTAAITLMSTGGSCPVAIPAPPSPVATVSGAATFSGLTVPGKRTGCQLTASSSGLASGLITFNAY